MKYWSCIFIGLFLTLASQGLAKKHSKKRHVRVTSKASKKQGGSQLQGNLMPSVSRTVTSSKKSDDFQQVPGLMDSAPNLGGGLGGMNPLGGPMGDLSMGFGAGATSIGEGGGATMEGMPSMMGGGMPMPGGMTGAAGMQMPGGVETGPMAMQMPGAAGGPQEGAAMSKQFIEGPEGGMAGMRGMPNMPGMGMAGMTSMPQMGGMGGFGGMGGGLAGMNMEGGMPNMGAMGNAGGAGAMFTSAQELGGQMGGSMGGPMPNAFQNALGGGMPGMSQKRAKMGKVHKLFSKLSKKKNGKSHHKN
ncbi:PE-PGRS family protein PE_PGRS61-like isoform X1 [Acropora muricata]|uniref:PE-PGRS family protein PE_PGRS61-like isoform X1 n=1 Tax=Acropora muricata TaxID=159855 RepID=UPI0010FC8DCD